MKRLNGFSLMEMMVVLTIVAIVAAASAPMVNKKMVRAAGDGSPWQWANGGGTSIGYNFEPEGRETKTASIGVLRAPNTINNARLYIDTQSDATPHIAFGRRNGDNDHPIFKLIAGGERNNLWLSNQDISAGANRAVALGYNANAADDHTVAIGNNARATFLGAIAIGQDALAENDYNVAIGHNTRTNDAGGIAIGSGARTDSGVALAGRSSGTVSIAIGSGSEALKNNSIAIGRDAKIASSGGNGSNSIVIGNGSFTNNDDTIVIGRGGHSGGNGAIALGLQSVAGANSIALGTPGTGSAASNATASGANSIAIGRGPQATATNSIAIGNDAQATATNSVAIGRGARATETNNIVIGTSNDIVRIPGTLIPRTIVLENLHITGNLTVDKNAFLNIANTNTGKNINPGEKDYRTYMWIASKDKNRQSGIYSLQHRKLTDRHWMVQTGTSYDGSAAEEEEGEGGSGGGETITPETQSKISELEQKNKELEAKIDVLTKKMDYIVSTLNWDMSKRMHYYGIK